MITSRANAVIVLAAGGVGAEEEEVDDELGTAEAEGAGADGVGDGLGHSLGTGGADRCFEGDLTDSVADADAALDLDEFELGFELLFELLFELGFELELGDCCLWE